MPNIFPWAMVAATILLTTYGQLILKWQVGVQAPPLFSWMEKLPPIIILLFRPWVISAFIAAFSASLCWMLAISKLEMSRAYPFMSLNFLLVCALAVPLFGEKLSAYKIIGISVVMLGLVILSQDQ